MTLAIVERTFPIDPTGLLPAITPDSEPFWSGLAAGEVRLQGCRTCDKLRYPIAPVCPHCGATGFGWRTVAGQGTLFSWVRYHRSYLPEFDDVMPYVVATVDLGGVRMYGRLLDAAEPPAIGMPVEMVIERWPDGRCVPAFRSTRGSEP